VAFYTSDGVAKQGLTDVTASVVKPGSGVVSSPTVHEDPGGNGFYYCSYTPNSDGAFVCIFKTADSSVDQKHLAGIAFMGSAGVNNLDAAMTSRPAASDYTTARAAKLDNLDAATSSRANATDYTAARAAKLDNLDAAVSTRPTAAQIDEQLSDSHGAGSWQSYAVNALILRLSEDELDALLDGQA